MPSLNPEHPLISWRVGPQNRLPGQHILLRNEPSSNWPFWRPPDKHQGDSQSVYVASNTFNPTWGRFFRYSPSLCPGSPGPGNAARYPPQSYPFLFGFYLLLVGSKVVVALLAGRSRKLLAGRPFRLVMCFLGVLLGLFAFLLFREGWKQLAVL